MTAPILRAFNTLVPPLLCAYAPDVIVVELGMDTLTYTDALKHVVRQDPDVILLGEMRDLETMSAALTAAQTGHLVLSTIHTIDAIQTVTRVVDMFPPYQQNQIRLQLADI